MCYENTHEKTLVTYRKLSGGLYVYRFELRLISFSRTSTRTVHYTTLTMAIEFGSFVKIFGLTSDWGCRMKGKIGLVCSIHLERGRVGVEILGIYETYSPVVGIKESNLEIASNEQGNAVH